MKYCFYLYKTKFTETLKRKIIKPTTKVVDLCDDNEYRVETTKDDLIYYFNEINKYTELYGKSDYTRNWGLSVKLTVESENQIDKDLIYDRFHKIERFIESFVSERKLKELFKDKDIFTSFFPTKYGFEFDGISTMSNIKLILNFFEEIEFIFDRDVEYADYVKLLEYFKGSLN